MPTLETIAEFVEALADLCGAYQQGIHFRGLTPAESRQQEDWTHDHADDCQCRRCWTGAMERRIREAVSNEQRLHLSPEPPPHDNTAALAWMERWTQIHDAHPPEDWEALAAELEAHPFRLRQPEELATIQAEADAIAARDAARRQRLGIASDDPAPLPALRPCPGCGHAAPVLRLYRYVECGNDTCDWVYFSEGAGEQTLVTGWNHRVPDPATEALREAYAALTEEAWHVVRHWEALGVTTPLSPMEHLIARLKARLHLSPAPQPGDGAGGTL